MQFDRAVALRQIRSTPPRCLSQLVCQFDEKPAIEENGHIYSGWSISCRCGSARGRLLGHESADPQHLAPPLAFECVACKMTSEVLDAAKHGYAGELRPGKRHGPRPGRPKSYACPGCSGTEFALSCVFIIPDAAFDLVEDDLAEDTGFGHAENIHNLFDQFAAECTCAACGRRSFAASMELK